jgi:hypothetical protein
MSSGPWDICGLGSKKLLHLLAAGMAVGGAGVFHHGRFSSWHMHDMLFRKVDQGRITVRSDLLRYVTG